MPNPNILQGPSIGIYEDLVHLFQHVQTLDDPSKDGVGRIQVLDPSFGESDEELRTASTLRSWSDGHGDGSTGGVLETRDDGRFEVARDRSGRGGRRREGSEMRAEGLSSGSGGGGISSLSDKVFGDCGEERERKGGRMDGWTGRRGREVSFVDSQNDTPFLTHC